MPVSFTRDQVLAMSPDASSVKAAQKLMSPGKWALLEFDDDAVWGECKGSGQKPYLVQIALAEPAFKCSCPSRKFPCKHGLALLVLYADGAASFQQATAPPRVAEWLESRQGRAEKKAQRAADKAAKPVDPESVAKREAKRREEMEAGLADFDLWLQDLVRQGLAALPSRGSAYWSEPAARLVDAKATGMANWLIAARQRLDGTADSPPRVLAALGYAYLLRRAFANFESLEPDQQADVRTALGWHLDKDAVLASGEQTREPMRVLGLSLTENDRLRERRVWLQGESSGRPALILDFAHGRAPFDALFQVGSVVDLELAFYPSALPMRALVRERHGEPRPLGSLQGPVRLEDALGQVASWLAANPWIPRLPLALRSMRFLPDAGGWLLLDGAERALPVHPSFQHGWTLMAMAGGRGVDLFGEWRTEGLMPLGCLGEDGGYVSFACEEVA